VRRRARTADRGADPTPEVEVSRLQIRCLGDFEVRQDGRPVVGFESLKVRALLAYMVCQRERAFTREHLASLLWPERREEVARRNLRQALYNLRTALGTSSPPLETVQGQLRIAPDFDFWLDVKAFENALRRIDPTQTLDTHRLAGAVRLYRGEFLSGFPLRDSSAFEDWLLTERERLREGVVTVLRTLIESYLARGELRVGLQYARRLVALDPLSEEAHRYLMRLFAYSGRRSRALAQYQELESLLERELGVEPLAETRRLYEAILTEKSPLVVARDDSEPIGPVVPLVGRTQSYGQLTATWRQVQRGRSRVTLIKGEPGVGKSRLARAFLDAASHQAGLVLTGQCQDRIRLPYEPFPALLRSALAEGSERVERALAAAPPALLADVALLVPELREQKPELPAAEPLAPGGGARRLFDAVTSFFGLLVSPPGTATPPAPLILYVDDLHLARLETFELLCRVLEGLSEAPLWLIATGEPLELDDDHPFAVYAAAHEGRVERLELGRLSSAEVEEIATWLVGSAPHEALAQLLERLGEGLPLQITELINYLWDDGALVAGEEGRWRLHRGAPARLPATTTFDALMGLRLRRLPSSARRLTVLAAVIGHPFRPKLLERAADEHMTVVEVGLEIMLERWFVRRFVDHWTTGDTAERPTLGDVSAAEAQRASFIFAHARARDAVYRILAEDRRRVVHGEVASALADIYHDDEGRVCELLAYHFSMAREWAQAVVHLERAADRAHAVQARQTAAYYDRQCIDALDRLIASTEDPEELARFKEQRRRLARRQAA